MFIRGRYKGDGRILYSTIKMSVKKREGVYWRMHLLVQIYF